MEVDGVEVVKMVGDEGVVVGKSSRAAANRKEPHHVHTLDFVGSKER